MTRVMILRHAPQIHGGRLAGRRDVDADCGDEAAFARVRARLPHGIAWLCSPARRCRQTAAALGCADPATDPALWEQDHGVSEGVAFDRLPDLGPLSVADLARYRPEGGESFDDMAVRVQPVLRALTRDTLIVGHAGTARAGLAMVVGAHALSFTVAPLSLTVLRHVDGGDWAVEGVNLS